MAAQNSSTDMSLTIHGTKTIYAALEDWEIMKPYIKKLYLDEDRTLNDVMGLMASQYHHRGT